MKVFFDTNVYVAEALLGDAATRMLEATSKASWRIFSSSHVLAEIERVIVERLGFSRRFPMPQFAASPEGALNLGKDPSETSPRTRKAGQRPEPGGEQSPRAQRAAYS